MTPAGTTVHINGSDTASTAASTTARDKEALRQQMLLRALWHDARPAVVAGWMRDGESFARGLQAYQASAGALAERALAAAYPTVMQLLGDESFAGLARAFWHRHAPLLGDVACWGAELPAFIAAADQLAEEPYLADVARLEWAVHTAHTAADGPAAPQGLHLLAQADPATLWLQLQPGAALVVSTHPVVAIWQAHRAVVGRGADDGDDGEDSDDSDEANEANGANEAEGGPDGAHDRFAGVRQALAEGRAESALVCRQGWRVRVHALPAATLPFVRAVLQGQPLAGALAAAQAQAHTPAFDFDFEPWLIGALQAGWLAGASLAPPLPRDD